ncbi:MAG: sigma 54-dependent Fis family transcriptional regulator [Deltaproteobacteria bacterium]|nr:sigma 54-dependent Fis family transcriptional regulator [Deltaproteobacteria bacterium]
MSDATVPVAGAGLPIRALEVEVTDGPDRGRTATSSSDTLTIGTAAPNDLVLSDPTVSRYHADLVRRHDRIAIVDHGSTNGTWSLATRIERGSVAPGSTLRLGRTSIRVGDGEPFTIELYPGERLGRLLGRSPAMRLLMARIERAARSDSSVLLLGETGVGKEVVARALHDASPRSKRPFEIVDCGAMLPTLVASELFGHEKGAFTGADRQASGAFERADGGTLFLDEIGELPQSLQTSLLGALERRAFRRVGGKETISVDVRVVAATNRDLRTEVNAGTFRQDLFFRLAVVTLAIPPLRDRREDIALLALSFLRALGHSGSLEEVLPPKTIEALERHSWPGNVRELKNAVEAAWVMGEAPPLTEEARVAPSGDRFHELFGLPYSDARERLVDAFEDAYARALLDRSGGNVSLAAREARMSRSYLTKLLRRRGIRSKSDGE